MAMPAELAGAAQVARRSDMDMNGHINNVVYLAWTLESVPATVFDTYTLHQVRPPQRRPLPVAGAGPFHPARCTRGPPDAGPLPAALPGGRPDRA
jgi:hypothetical protein